MLKGKSFSKELQSLWEYRNIKKEEEMMIRACGIVDSVYFCSLVCYLYVFCVSVHCVQGSMSFI